MKNQYPSSEDLKLDSALSFILTSLRTALETLFIGKDARHKVVAVGHAIIQAVRPRAVIALLQVGLAVQIHHLYRSKFIVDTLHEMGFCSSYKEVIRFEKNAADCVEPDVLGGDVDLLEMSVLFAADNVDHSIITLDGKGKFHGMGVIASITPAKQMNYLIPRRQISELKTENKTKIPILEYRFARHACHEVVFKDLSRFLDCDKRIDIMREVSLGFKEATPNWQGLMHILHQGSQHPGKSSVKFLPMISMYSGDKPCIVSTLDFVCNLAMKHNLPTIVTFNQPLYWKAAEIMIDAPQSSYLKDIVLMLGCFHTLMNLLGAIGTLMEGTGLKNILETVYGENAVVHMMTGKAVHSALWGHLLVDKCLHSQLIKEMVKDNPEIQTLLDQAEELHSSLISGETTLRDAASSEVLIELETVTEKKKSELAHTSKTSQLWLNYQRMVVMTRMLIKADRTGSWLMHLQAVSNCLTVFAAAGHFNYLRSAHYYLQQMSSLEEKHPDVYRKFCDGFHVVRRSNHSWAGLSSDLVIEQTLMRSLKSTGGLTHGSGMIEDMRNLCTLSAPVTSEYNCAIQDFTDLTYTTSPQHKDSTEARIKKDASDLEKIRIKLAACSPFTSDPTLRNVVNGIVAGPDVNVHAYESVGNKIIEDIVGKSAFTYKFKRKDRAQTLGNISAVKIAPDRTTDPALLFQRFLVVSRSGDLSLEEVLTYELSPYPPALFEARNILRKADKPQLAKAIRDHAADLSSEAVMNSIPKTDCYVLDGGSLLHRLPWKKGDSYNAIAESYAEFTVRCYGQVTVVFDGYGEGPSIKDSTHQRRGKNLHPIISFTAETEFSGKKEDFLSRDKNKADMIAVISTALTKRGHHVIQSPGDADVDIVKATVERSRHCTTTLVGEDTDLLILLLHYSRTDNEIIYFRSDANKQSREHKVYNINQLKEALGDDVCNELLFVHAYSGCDSTSRIFGIGKKSAFQKLVKSNPVMKSCASAFILQNKSQEDISDLGEDLMVDLFCGKSNDTLSSLRHTIFTNKVATAEAFVTPERLPPTSPATRFHSQRVYFQIMVWMGKANEMNPTKWGWKQENDQLIPVMTQNNAAPEKLLKIIHCNCSGGCKSPRCSCRRYELPCTAVCGPCQTENCDNPNNTQEVDTEEEDDTQN